MSTIELEPVSIDQDDDIPDILHLVEVGNETKTLCGMEVLEVLEDDTEEEPDCVVCLAEAERLGL